MIHGIQRGRDDGRGAVASGPPGRGGRFGGSGGRHWSSGRLMRAPIADGCSMVWRRGRRSGLRAASIAVPATRRVRFGSRRYPARRWNRRPVMRRAPAERPRAGARAAEGLQGLGRRRRLRRGPARRPRARDGRLRDQRRRGRRCRCAHARVRRSPGQFLAYGLVVWWYCRRRGDGLAAPRPRVRACSSGTGGRSPLGTVSAIGLGLLVLPLRQLVDENQGVVDDLLDSSGAEARRDRDRGGPPRARSSRSSLFRGAAAAVAARPDGAELGDRGQRAGRSARSTSSAATRSERSRSLPALVGIGVISGVLAVRSGELSQSILLHMGFNLLAVVGARSLS